MATIKVHSGLPNAIELRLHDMVDAEHGAYSINPGIKTANRRRNFQPVIIKRGMNDVDADFWNEWAEQNKDTGIRGALLVFGDEPTRAPPAPMERETI